MAEVLPEFRLKNVGWSGLDNYIMMRNYSAEEIGQWQVEARGKVFQSCLKTLPNPHGFAYKKRVYSPNRIRYPLKRIDWEPNGERNQQNRGRGKYKRITWDEVTDIIASEIKMIQKKYGRCNTSAG